MNHALLHKRLDLAAVALLTFSLFGFLGNVMLDYNWGTNEVTSSFALAYSMTLRRAIPFPLGYYGIGAAIYFALFVLSFLFLNRKETLYRNFLQSLSLVSATVILFELGILYFVPYFMGKWVIDAARGTTLQAFTNWDLLGLAACVFLFSRVFLARTCREKRDRHQQI